MATSISANGFKVGLGSSFHGSWGSSIAGEDYTALAKSVPNQVRVGKPVRPRTMMKNVNEGKGLFAPIVVLTRNIVGKKRFNQLRGKAIALHSQVLLILRISIHDSDTVTFVVQIHFRFVFWFFYYGFVVPMISRSELSFLFHFKFLLFMGGGVGWGVYYPR